MRKTDLLGSISSGPRTSHPCLNVPDAFLKLAVPLALSAASAGPLAASSTNAERANRSDMTVLRRVRMRPRACLPSRAGMLAASAIRQDLRVGMRLVAEFIELQRLLDLGLAQKGHGELQIILL